LNLLQEQCSFGILITPATATMSRIDEIRRSGTPAVLVDRGPSRQCSVSVDDVVGGGLALAHLLAMGHRRIAFGGGPLKLSQVADRLAGGHDAVREAGLADNRLVVIDTAGRNVAARRRTGEQIAAMPRNRRPTAVFCANDLLALGVLQEMTRRKLSVPGDLAIVGYDDIDFAAAAAVPLTSVRRPRYQLGHAATKLLVEEVAEREPTGTARLSSNPNSSCGNSPTPRQLRSDSGDGSLNRVRALGEH
jgi:LacI family transcriptional regulator